MKIPPENLSDEERCGFHADLSRIGYLAKQAVLELEQRDLLIPDFRSTIADMEHRLRMVTTRIAFIDARNVSPPTSD